MGLVGEKLSEVEGIFSDGERGRIGRYEGGGMTRGASGRRGEVPVIGSGLGGLIDRTRLLSPLSGRPCTSSATFYRIGRLNVRISAGSKRLLVSLEV